MDHWFVIENCGGMCSCLISDCLMCSDSVIIDSTGFPTLSGKSVKVLNFFFTFFMPLKLLENSFSPEKSWKLQ